MKIVHLLSQTHLTGAEVYAATLARAQYDGGHQVYQVSNGFFHETPAEKFELEVETKSRLCFFKNARWLRKFLIVNQIQVIHTHSRAAAKLAFYARLGLKVGMVSTVHGQQHNSISKKLFSQYGEMIVAVCENIKIHLQKDFSYDAKRILVVRNAIDAKIFSEPTAFEKNSNNTSINRKKIAIIGRTTGPKKTRTELVLKALIEMNADAEIFLIGGQLKDLDLVPSAKARVTEVGNKQLSGAIYHNYDIVVGAGRVCMEALLSGVPTIAFGEAEYIGLVQIENYSRALASNFGDINLNSTGPRLETAVFKHDIEIVLGRAEIRALRELALKDFSLSSISPRIQRIYESAYFLRNYSKWIPILMYHKIPSTEINSQHRIFVLKKNFEKHLQFFKWRGFKTLTFSELARFRRGEIDFAAFPKKPLVLTFDDGYRDNLENASPLLKKYNFRAQLFLLADSGINHNEWDAHSDEPAHEIVSGLERKHWLQSAFEIGSHGFSHRKITELSEGEALLELKSSKESLEKEFNIPINTFAFTYGITTAAAADWAFQAGYDYSVNTDSGGLLLEEAPYQIFRVNIFPEDDFFSLWKKTSSWYRNYYFNKRKK
ncbi:MAG: polysaccharide deacetylase family protein [Bdellovibrionaceae bacterium]|nr:polysaccharide deacetylase family protein [Bdellovibrio sp.]